MDSERHSTLTGTLYQYPFGTVDRPDAVAQHFQDLSQAHAADSILCLTRLCGEREIAEAIVNQTDSVIRPTVASIPEFALDLLHIDPTPIDHLSNHARIELLADFLEDYDWNSQYLDGASQYEAFPRDVGELLIEFESHNSQPQDAFESPAVGEMATVAREFQSALSSEGFVDEPSVLPRAIETLREYVQNGEIPAELAQWDVILIADFEECGPVQRRFLHHLSEATGADCDAIGENHCRLLSSWRESGDLADMASGLSIQSVDQPRMEADRIQAIASYLVSGDRPEQTADSGTVRVIETRTFRDQLTSVADEIEHLCRKEEHAYSDVIVAYQDSSAPVGATLRLLRRNGIPTTTVGTNQLNEDPAVRELYDVVDACATEAASGTSSPPEKLLNVPNATSSLLHQVQTADAPSAGLWQWIESTQLKDRIATEYGEIEVKNQFRRVREVIDLLEFLDATPQLDGSWAGALAALNRAFQYASSRFEQIKSFDDAGGVRVGSIYGLKHTAAKTVFLLNVTDQAYPSIPHVSSLFPLDDVRSEPNFPLLTSMSSADVAATFPPATADSEDPFHDYFTQISRRLLGIGASAATDRLYFGVPHESEDALGTYNQPSRFLEELVDTFAFIEPQEKNATEPVSSHGAASEYAVDHIDRTLEAVRRAGVGGEPVDLDAYESELAGIASVVDQEAASAVRDALKARVDYRQGRVRND